MNILARIWDWTMGAAYRTWLAHFVLAVLLSLAFGPWAVAVMYMLREVEQAFLKWKATGDFDGRDAVLDALAPLLGASAVALTGWMA